MLCQSKARFFSGVLRTISTTPTITASHYDVLGVTPRSTQSDIKSAYYKLSKLYHPDTSKDEESAKKFRSITEAYEVLGNIKLKKMYDKGLLVGTENTSRMDIKPDSETDNLDPALKFYKSRNVRHVVPTMDGRTPIYDFDTWSKNHYGDLLKKSQYEKNFVKGQNEKRVNVKIDNNQEKIMYMMLSFFLFFIALIIYGQNDYDLDTVEKHKKKEQSSSET